MDAACQGNLSACHRLVSPVIYEVRPLARSHSVNRRGRDTDSCVIHMLHTVAIQSVVINTNESFRAASYISNGKRTHRKHVIKNWKKLVLNWRHLQEILLTQLGQ